jgi:hypothetical protein
MQLRTLTWTGLKFPISINPVRGMPEADWASRNEELSTMVYGNKHT